MSRREKYGLSHYWNRIHSLFSILTWPITDINIHLPLPTMSNKIIPIILNSLPSINLISIHDFFLYHASITNWSITKTKNQFTTHRIILNLSKNSHFFERIFSQLGKRKWTNSYNLSWISRHTIQNLISQTFPTRVGTHSTIVTQKQYHVNSLVSHFISYNCRVELYSYIYDTHGNEHSNQFLTTVHTKYHQHLLHIAPYPKNNTWKMENTQNKWVFIW